MRTSVGLLLTIFLILGNPRVGAQIAQIHGFTNLNKMIPDGNACGLSDVRIVSSTIANLSAVRAKLHISGQFNGDLYSYLRHIQIGGTNFCVLLNRVGRAPGNAAGYADAGLDVTLDDGAAQGDIHLYRAVTNPAANTSLTGIWQPDGRRTDPDLVQDTTSRTAMLSAFNGADAGGEWTLYVVDLAAGGTNMLVSWELDLTGMARPVLTWPTPADMVYGSPLGNAQLNASSPIPGTFNYNPPVGTVLNSGSNQILTVTFIPTDATSYLPASTNATINVLKAGTTGSISSSANPALPGQMVAFNLNLNAVTPGQGIPTGTVQFKIDGTNTGGAVPIIGGAASYSTSALTHGAHMVTAEYAGDGNFYGTTNSLSPNQLINTPPIAGPVVLQRYPTAGVKIAVETLLSNASDADGDAIAFVGASGTSANGGTLTISNSWISYTPPAGFTNGDTFTYTVSDGVVAVTGLVTVNIRLDNGPSPNLTIIPIGHGAYTIRGDGIPGRTYQIQFSDSTVGIWQTLGAALADSFGIFQFTDSAGSPQRFYRSVYP